MFIDSDNVYISVFSGYNIYECLNNISRTFEGKEAINVKHLVNGEEYYLIKSSYMYTKAMIEEFYKVVKRPIKKNMIWPIDLAVNNDTFYLVYPVKFYSKLTNMDMFNNEESFFGFEKAHGKMIIERVLNLFIDILNHKYLYHIWSERVFYINDKKDDIIVVFSDLLSCGIDSITYLDKGKYICECYDPYLNKTGKPADYYSELFAMNSLLFKLLIGIYPFEGKKLDGIPKYEESIEINKDSGYRDLIHDEDYIFWINKYLDNPIFIFDAEDKRNCIGRLDEEKDYLKRWNSLSDNTKKMFQETFSYSNVMREKENIVANTPQMWKDALKDFDYKIK